MGIGEEEGVGKGKIKGKIKRKIKKRGTRILTIIVARQ